MSLKSSIVSYSISLIIGFAVLYGVLIGQHAFPRVQQVQFDNWYLDHRKGQKLVLPKLQLVIDSPVSNLKLEYAGDSSVENNQNTEKLQNSQNLTKIIEFIHSAEIFSNPVSAQAPALKIEINTGSQNFYAGFDLEQIKNNIKLQNFLVLLSVLNAKKS